MPTFRKTSASSFVQRAPISRYSPGPRRRFPVAMTSGSQLTVFPDLADLINSIDPINYVNGPYVVSPSSEWEAVRLFGKTEMDVRVCLYRDHASWCPYCHKVQLMLERKRIPYAIKKENMNSYGEKSEAFLRRNPGGLLPVILLDGELKKESNEIMFLIEDTFQQPHPRTIPVDDNERMQAFHQYMRLERILTGAWLTALRCPIVQYPFARGALIQVLDMVEKSLFEFMGPYFLGEEPSFIDILYAPILMRISSTLKYFRNMDPAEGRPNLANWYSAMYSWEPSRKLMSDDISYALSIPPQIGPVRFLPNRTEVSTNIDKARSKHMLNDGDEKKADRLEAAERFLNNFEAVFKDACKGAQTVDISKSAVELAFRAVAGVLVDPNTLEKLEAGLKEEIVEDDRQAVCAALRFMRGRACTPRDMTVDGLVQFCGAINWCIRTLGLEA